MSKGISKKSVKVKGSRKLLPDELFRQVVYLLSVPCSVRAILSKNLTEWMLQKTAPSIRLKEDWFDMAKQFCKNIENPRDGKTVHGI